MHVQQLRQLQFQTPLNWDPMMMRVKMKKRGTFHHQMVSLLVYKHRHHINIKRITFKVQTYLFSFFTEEEEDDEDEYTDGDEDEDVDCCDDDCGEEDDEDDNDDNLDSTKGHRIIQRNGSGVEILGARGERELHSMEWDNDI